MAPVVADALEEVKGDWDKYLAQLLETAQSVPSSAFVMPSLHPTACFELGDKLELEVPAVKVSCSAV